MKIYITGSPGTGKSTLGEELEKRLEKIEFFEIRQLLEANSLLVEYEPERDTTIFDEEPVINFLEDFFSEKDFYILAGPFLPFESLKFDYLIVLTCSKRELLANRLAKRNYRQTKIEENLEAEFVGEILGNTLDWLTSYNSDQEPIIYDTCTLDCKTIVQQFINQLSRA